ncbi:DMT family transporter [Anaeromyxobacter sp. K]|uniref:DMT family transporter n=1 Tax=Anaeromyxobacter sp. (strain K) TaxID=447217 RepID=UPI00059D8FE5|nr:DMT family transporter [Anaeromyxobacter sp. K]
MAPPEIHAGALATRDATPARAAGGVAGGRSPDRGRLRRRARALLFASAVLFGASAALAKLAARQGMSGGQATLVRFAIGLAAVLALFRARPGTFRPHRKDLLFARGLFGGVAALLYFLAIERIPAGEATLLNNTFPIWAVLLSLFVLNERPTVHLWIALAVASAGVWLVLGGGSVRLGLGWGEGLGIVSGVLGGAAVTAIRALRPTDNAPTIFFSFSVGGLLVSLPFALQAWPSAPGAYLAALGVGAVAFLAQLSMTEAYGALSVPEAALWQQLTPIASYLWALSLGERLSLATVLGVLLGLGGILYGSLLGHAPREARSREARMAEGLPAEEP